jgi:hypothetical protein
MSRPSKAMRQLLEFQDRLFAAGSASETKSKDLAAIACAWERLEERKRVMRMKPKPRDVDVSVTSRASRRISQNSVVVPLSMRADVLPGPDAPSAGR